MRREPRTAKTPTPATIGAQLTVSERVLVAGFNFSNGQLYSWGWATLDFTHASLIRLSSHSKYPPAKPEALGREPLKAAGTGAQERSRSDRLRRPDEDVTGLIRAHPLARFCAMPFPFAAGSKEKLEKIERPKGQPERCSPLDHCRKSQTATVTPAEPGGFLWWLSVCPESSCVLGFPCDSRVVA